MPAGAGMIESFLDAFGKLTAIDSQRRAERQRAAEFAVDTELKKSGLLEQVRARQQEQANWEQEHALKLKAEERLGEQAKSLANYRDEQIDLAGAKLTSGEWGAVAKVQQQAMDAARRSNPSYTEEDLQLIGRRAARNAIALFGLGLQMGDTSAVQKPAAPPPTVGPVPTIGASMALPFGSILQQPQMGQAAPSPTAQPMAQEAAGTVTAGGNVIPPDAALPTTPNELLNKRIANLSARTDLTLEQSETLSALRAVTERLKDAQTQAVVESARYHAALTAQLPEKFKWQKYVDGERLKWDGLRAEAAMLQARTAAGGQAAQAARADAAEKAKYLKQTAEQAFNMHKAAAKELGRMGEANAKAAATIQHLKPRFAAGKSAADADYKLYDAANVTWNAYHAKDAAGKTPLDYARDASNKTLREYQDARSAWQAFLAVGSKTMGPDGTPVKPPTVLPSGTAAITGTFTTRPGTSPLQAVKRLTMQKRVEFMRKANGNVARAKQLAEEAGYR